MRAIAIDRFLGATLKPSPALDFETSPTAAKARDLLNGLNTRAGGFGPVAVDRPLVLYGAGNLGKLARAHLDLVGMPIALVVDAQAAAYRNDSDWAGLDIVAPADVPPALKREALLAVSIVNCRFATLQANLARAGWARCVPFYDIAEGFRATHPLGNGWFAQPLDATHLSLCAHVLDGWADDASRAHHLRFAAWRLCREDWHFIDADVDPSSRFFIPEVLAAFEPRERVLDAGAHHGTFLDRFMAVAPGALLAAWALEPDGANRAVLEDWAATIGPATRDRLSIHDTLIGADGEIVRFHDGLGYASQIAATGRTVRTTRSIDALGFDPTVIKLHLEGAELTALKGAIGTLRRCRPIVMATVYHNDDGLGRTAHWLMRKLENYRFLMRTHSWCGTGAVIYALPAERSMCAEITTSLAKGT